MNKAEGNVDLIVQQEFYPEGSTPGVFVDVGAASPDYLSICALYRTMGWKVIAIEPNPDFCQLHRQKGYDILQYACGTHDEDNVDFYVVDSHGATYAGGNVSFESFSSLGIKDNYATIQSDLDVKNIKVDMRRLDTILKTHYADVDKVNILSIDVEGWELEVLEGFDIGKYMPDVMIIENYFDDNAYWDYMKGYEYELWKHISFNDIYISRELASKMA